MSYDYIILYYHVHIGCTCGCRDVPSKHFVILFMFVGEIRGLCLLHFFSSSSHCNFSSCSMSICSCEATEEGESARVHNLIRIETERDFNGFQATILGRGPWESIPCHGNPNIMALQIPRSGLMSIRQYRYVFISIYNPLLTMKHIIIYINL